MRRLRNQMTIVAAGLLTAVLIPATAVASVESPAGAEPIAQRHEAEPVASVDAALDARLEVRKVDLAEIRDMRIQVPSACTASDDEPYGFYVYGYMHGMTCYEAKGDDQWVLDTLDNNAHFWVYLETEYGKKRWCEDDTSGWTECKYDHREHECIIFAGNYQPGGDYFDWTPWISTTSGNPGCVRD